MRPSAYASAKDFVDRIVVAGRFETYTSELATRYARSAAVKQFARQMIAENRQTEQEFASTLEKAAIEPPIEALDIAYSAKLITAPELQAFAARLLPRLEQRLRIACALTQQR